MDSRDGKKKKESIDDILSDLNGLLNKMPSILDGIKMPEPHPEPAPAAPCEDKKDIPQPADADKTVVLPPFSGLPEGASAPAEIFPAPAAAVPQPEPAAAPAPVTADFDAEKTVVLESFSGLAEGAQVPEPKDAEPASRPDQAGDKIVLQSLGDFMFGADAEKNAPPAEEAAPLQEAAVPLPEMKPAQAEQPAPEAEPQRPGPEAVFPGLPAEPVESLNLAPLGLPAAEPSSRLYDTTHDFGIPDIDALLQLSENNQSAGEPVQRPEPVEAAAPEQPAAPEPEPAPVQEASMAPAADPGEPVPTGDELAEFEQQLKAAAPQQGENVDNNKPEEEKTEISLQAEEQQAPPADAAAFVIEPEAPKPTGFEAFTIEPSSSGDSPAQEAGETLRLEPSEPPSIQPDQAGETLQAEPAVPVIETGAGLTLGEPETPQEPQPGGEELSLGVQPEQAAETLQATPAEPAIEIGAGFTLGGQTEPQPEAQAGAELTVGSQGDSTQQFQAAAPQGIELEPTSAVLSGSAPAPAAGLSGEETLVVAPPSGASGDEEKTVIFEAGAFPGATSRSQAGDLAGLAERPVPEGIPAERVKGIVFLYSPDDKALCATVLSELDAICLKSASKPMFIKRSSVRTCEADLNANVALQIVQEAGAAGLICVGAVPQEKIYELENTFSGASGFFRHYDSSSFSHSAALDLVADLILR